MKIDDYKYKYDLHVHTSPVSMCGDIEPRGVVDRYSDLGFSGIVITNHFSALVLRDYKTKDEFIEFYMKDFREAYEYGKEKGVNVILGLEARFPENANDYLVFGITEEDVYRAYDFIFDDYENFYKGFKNEHNLILQAHPYRKMCTLQRCDLLDGIEVFNMHPHHNSAVALAAKTARENPHFVITAGTDFHHEGHQGLGATLFKEEIKDSLSLASALKSRDCIFEVCSNKIIPYMG